MKRPTQSEHAEVTRPERPEYEPPAVVTSADFQLAGTGCAFVSGEGGLCDSLPSTST